MSSGVKLQMHAHDEGQEVNKSICIYLVFKATANIQSYIYRNLWIFGHLANNRSGAELKE